MDEFTSEFLITYRTYMTPSNLLRMLIDKYNNFDGDIFTRVDKMVTLHIRKQRYIHSHDALSHTLTALS
mgnify:FL=1